MQGLASYGSDEDDDESGNSQSTATRPVPVASSSRPPLKPSAKPSETPPAPSQPVVDRLKSTAGSRAPSPLSGVKLNTPAASPRTVAPSPAKPGKRRTASSSPPPYSAAPIAAEPSEGGEEGAGNGHGKSPAVGVQLNSLAEFGVPPMVTGPCNPSVEAKLANYHSLAQTRGLYFNDTLQASKAFRNPRIYAKLVELIDVDETGTNWPSSVWDPHGLPSGSSAAALSELQKLRSEQRAAAQAPGARTSIAFASSSNPQPSTTRDDDPARRHERDHRRDRDRDRDRDHRERDKDRGERGERGEKRSRWDAGATASKRDRSRSPRRH